MRFMRLSTRAITAAIFSVLLGACSIGEGNGIVSIEIVDLNGNSELEMRADQCEGLLVALVATFTDGQQTVYTHRADWSVVEGSKATINELKNSNDFTTAVEVIPTAAATSGDTLQVKADYLGLSTTKDITVNDLSIQSLQIQPPKAALITDDFQTIYSDINVTMTLSDGSLILNPVRALEAEIDTPTSLVVKDSTENSLLLLDTKDDNLNELPPGTETVSFTYCSRLDDVSAEKTVDLEATHYAFNNTNIKLQITENFDGQGFKPVTNTDYRIPAGNAAALGAQLAFANGTTRTLNSSDVEWEIVCPVASCSTVLSDASLDVRYKIIETSDAETVSIAATYNHSDTESLTAEISPNLVIPELAYQDPDAPFELTDETGTQITSSDNVDVAGNSIRLLTFAALLVDDNGTAGDTSDDQPYRLLTNPSFTLANTDDEALLSFSGASIFGADTGSGDNIAINTAPSATLDGYTTNNLASLAASLYQGVPDSLGLDTDDDISSLETNLTLDVGDTVSLQAVLQFSGRSPLAANDIDIVTTAAFLDDTNRTTWGVEIANNGVVAVKNKIITSTENSGQLTALSSGSAIVTAYTSYTDSEGTVHPFTATINITVN